MITITERLILRQAHELHDAWSLGGLPRAERDAWCARGRRPLVSFDQLPEAERERWLFAARRLAERHPSGFCEGAAVQLLLRRGYAISGPGAGSARDMEAPAPTPPEVRAEMDRGDWITAFVATLTTLRPHLAPRPGGASKLVSAIATQQWAAHREENPARIARAYHERSKA